MLITTLITSIKLALRNLRQNKTRSILTIMGVFIGVTSVICIISLGEGVKAYFTKEIAKYGTNSIYLVPVAPKIQGKARNTQEVPFDNDQVDAIRRGATTVYDIEPGIQMGGVAKFGEKNYATSLYGGTENTLAYNSLELESGRMFTQAEIIGRERGVVLGAKARKNLFADWEDPIGQTIRFNGQTLQVIGLAKERGKLGDSEDVDAAIFVPFTTLQERFQGSDEVMYVLMRMKPGITREDVEKDLQPILRAQRKITDPTKDNFQFIVLDDFLKFSNQFLNILVMVFGTVAAIALLVGGVGLMNIMLVAVAERTREIGLRKALGAPGRAILFQFLTEAVVLTGLGGVGGLIAGWGLGFVVTPMLEKTFGEGIRPVVPWTYALITVGITGIVGIIFGVYPAMKASKMDPIRALRFD